MTEAAVDPNAPTTEDAPNADAEGTEVVEELDLKEQIEKSMKRNWDAPKHVAFAKWIFEKSEGKYTMDMATIVACQALYQVFRKSPEFEVVVAEIEAMGPRTKQEPDLKDDATPEEIKAALEKAEKRQKQLEKQAQQVAERAARVRELQARLAAKNAGESGEAPTTPEPAPAVEEPAF